MVEIFRGDFGTGKTTEIYERIKKDIENGIRTYLIVPEQQTLATERKMADILPAGAPLTFEVTNFTRLANTVFRSLGGVGVKYATATEKSLIMWRALCDCAPLLNEKIGDPDKKTVDKALYEMGELHSSGVLPSDLEAAAKKVKTEALSQRLCDLALILSTYSSLLEKEYADTENDLDVLTELLQSNDFFKGKKIYIDSFTSFTRQQYGIFSLLCSQCDVTVSVTLDTQSQSTVYAESLDFYKKIEESAKKNTELKLIKFENNKRIKSPLIYHVAKNIWEPLNFDAEYNGKDEEALTVYSAKDIYDECDFISSEISKKIREGARYRDFAIITPDDTSYLGILDDSMDNYAIPYFMSRRVDVASFSAVKFIISAYAVLGGGYRREDIITFLKCGLFNVSDDDVNLFESYIERYGISGKSHYACEDGFAMNPRGYVDGFTDRDREILGRVNSVRSALASALEKIDTDEKKTVREFLTDLVSFLDNCETEKMLSLRAKELKESNEVEAAEYTSRLWMIICDLLDRTVNTVGDAKLSFSSFRQLLRIVFSGITAGRIPSSLDEVTVSSAQSARIDGVKHVFIIGVNDGVFPCDSAKNALFSKNEIQELKNAGIEMPETISERELYNFMRAMFSPSDTLTVTYPLRDSRFLRTEPSFAVERIINIANGHLVRKEYENQSIFERIYTKKNAVRAIADLLSKGKTDLLEKLLSIPELNDVDINLENKTDNSVSKETEEKLLPSDIKLSQSLLDTYVKCPFAYYCKYILKLKENAESGFGNREIGTFVHASVEKLFEKLDSDGKKIYDLSNDVLENTVKDICADYVERVSPKGETNNPRLYNLFSHLEKTAQLLALNLKEELSKSKFYPKFFELNIGKDISPVFFDLGEGASAAMTGFIDRVDAYEKDGKTYVRIVDYKTGDHKLSRTDIAERNNLQLYIYLLSIIENGKKLFNSPPEVGAIEYKIVNTNRKELSSDTEDILIRDAVMKQYKRNMIILDDENVIAAANALDAKHTAITCDEFNLLLSDLKETVKEIGKGIRSGNAEIPKSYYLKTKESCKYCKMKSVCRSYVKVYQ